MWDEFRRKRGSLFTGRRIEQGIGYALYRYFLSHAEHPEKVKHHAFTPHEDQPREMSLEEYLEAHYGE